MALASPEDGYEDFGTYSTEDARRLLDAFVNSEIDFTLNPDQTGIAIAVQAEDMEQAIEIRQRVLKILP
jgi:hypothetical protein